MSRPGRVRRFVDFCSTTEPPTVLAAFRIAMGLMVLWTIGVVLMSGSVESLWMDVDHGGYRSLPKGNWLVELLGGKTPEMVWGMTIASVIGGVAMVAGLGGRVTVMLTLWAVMAATDFNSQASGSYDELLTSGMFCCVLGNTTATWSLDCRIKTGKWVNDTPVYSFPRWLAVFQIVLTYWATGCQKVSAYWVPGGDFSALYYILQQPSWHRAEMHWIAYVYPLTQAMTAVTWFWEVFFPLVWLAFWYRATRSRSGWLRKQFLRWDVRNAFVVVGVFLHLGVHALMNVGPFSFVTLAFYICMYHPDEYRKFGERVRARFSKTAA